VFYFIPLWLSSQSFECPTMSQEQVEEDDKRGEGNMRNREHEKIERQTAR
jgi:hypothetical protein